MFLEQLGKSNGQINFFFGFHLSISKTFVGGGPRINIKGQDLKFCVNLYTNIYFFKNLGGPHDRSVTVNHPLNKIHRLASECSNTI